MYNTSNTDAGKGWVSWHSDGCCTRSQQMCHTAGLPPLQHRKMGDAQFYCARAGLLRAYPVSTSKKDTQRFTQKLGDSWEIDRAGNPAAWNSPR